MKRTRLLLAAPLFALLGAAVCILLRVLAMYRDWHAPLPRSRGEPGP